MTRNEDLVLAVSVTVVAVSLCVVVLRLSSRILGLRGKATGRWNPLKVDDWLILAAWWLSLGLSVALIVGAKTGETEKCGTDRETWPADFYDECLKAVARRRKARYAYVFLYNPALAMAKNSILAFYLRLFRHDTALRIGAWATLALVNISMICLTGVAAFQCKPLSAAFVAIPSNARCIDTVKMIYASAPVHIITDVAILLLPMKTLTSLQLPLRQKLALVFAFTGGGFVTVVQVVSVYYFQRAADRSDFDWNVQLSFLWASITAGVGIISASVPMLKPILARYVPSIIGEHRKCSRSSDDARNSFQSEHTNNKDQHQNHHPHHQHHHQHDLHLHFHSHHNRHFPEPTSNNFLRPPELSDPGRRLSRTSRATTFHHNPADLSALSGKPATQWLAIIAVLFFSWGVAQGLLGSLVGKFDAAYGLTDAEKGGLNGSYFGAYIVTSLSFGGMLIRKTGFRLTIVTGLLIYGCGCMCFWPSSVQGSYPGIVISMGLVGIGCSLLEVAANLFATVCGPSRYAEMRLNLCQAIQGIGGLLALLLQTDEHPRHGVPKDPKIMLNFQWVYLACGFAVFIYAAAVYCSSLPELNNGEKSGIAATKKLFKGKRQATSLTLALLAMAVYVGAQECIRKFSGDFVRANLPNKSLHYNKLIQSLFTLNRLLAALLFFYLPAAPILLLSTLALIATSLCLIFLPSSYTSFLIYDATPPAHLVSPSSLLPADIESPMSRALHPTHVEVAVVAFLSNFFMGLIFPTIFVLAIRGAKGTSKTASSLLVAAVGGGAVLPGGFEAIQDRWGWESACVLLVVGFGVVALYPGWILGVPKERKRMKEGVEVGSGPATDAQNRDVGSSQTVGGGACGVNTCDLPIIRGGVWTGEESGWEPWGQSVGPTWTPSTPSPTLAAHNSSNRMLHHPSRLGVLPDFDDDDDIDDLNDEDGNDNDGEEMDEDESLDIALEHHPLRSEKLPEGYSEDEADQSPVDRPPTTGNDD